ncbi:MAG: flagellar hook-length control protein FliK, partial [Arthrobacter sp.]|nr:flagellar hook-length control protein FliK [Arthrobacter sp.]
PAVPGLADGLAAAGVAGSAAAPQTTAPAQTAAAPQAQAPAPAAQPALQPQLAKPLFTLAGAPHGEHIMTLKVTPEDLGPLTVRAHIDGTGVRIELFAPGDTGREALRGILPELRKELAGSGFGASLDVSDHNGPPGGQDAGRDAGRDGFQAGGGAGSGSDGRNAPGPSRPGHRWDALADEASLRTARILNGPQTTLDILV